MTYTGTLIGILLIIISGWLFFILEHDVSGFLIVSGISLGGLWLFIGNLISLYKSKKFC